MSGAPDKSLSLRIVTSTDGAGFQQAETGLSGVSAAVGAVSATLSSAADQADRFSLSMARVSQAGGGGGAVGPPLPGTGGSGTTTGPLPRSVPAAPAPAAPAPAPAPSPVRPSAPAAPASAPAPVYGPKEWWQDAVDQGWREVPSPAAPGAAGGGGEAPAGPAADGAQQAADATQKLNEKLNQTGTDAGKAKAALDGFKTATDAAAVASEAGGDAAAAAGEASADASEGAAEGKQEEAEGAEAAAEGAEEQEESTLSLEEQVQKLLDALGEKKKATKEAGDADDDAGDKTDKAADKAKKMGQAAVSAAYFLDDMRYGMKGIVNNIPDLVEKLGMGAGVAGALGILGVVIETVVTKFDVFGTAAKKLEEQQRQLIISSRNAAAAARQEAEDTNAAEAALEAHEDRIKNAEDAYSDLAEEIARVQAAREALNRAIMAETDEDLALRLLQIAQAKEEGLLTETDAIRQSGEAKRAAAAGKFQVEDDAASKELEELSRKAKKKDAEAAEKEASVQDLRRKGEGVLDSEGMKRVESEIGEAKRLVDDARMKLDRTPETDKYKMVFDDGSMVDTNMKGATPEEIQKLLDNGTLVKGDDKYETRNKEFLEAAHRYQSLLDKKEKSADAAKASGVADGDELSAKIKAEVEAEKKAREEAAAIRDDMETKAEIQRRNRRAQQTRVQVSEATDQLEITRAQKQQSDQLKREQARELQEKRERENEADAKQFEGLREQGVDTTKAQKDLADRRREERRAEDKRQEENEKEEKRRRLRAPDPMGPTLGEPGPWEGPTKSGFPPSPPPAPMMLGTPNERRHAMDNFGMTPADREAEARLSDQQARDRPAGRSGGSDSDSAASQSVRRAADALGRSAADNATAGTGLMQEMVGILTRQQRQIDDQTRILKTLETQIKEGRRGR